MSKRRRQISSFAHSNEEGFLLPLVVVIGFILSIGGMTLIARSFSGLYGSIRQEQSRQAKELAEAGLARTTERLNREYNYLLINCYAESGSPPSPNDCVNTGTWSAPELPSSICPEAESSADNMVLEESISDFNGRYRVGYYSYRGTQFYGGTGKLKVIGERLSDDQSRIFATSAVEMSFDVKPKPCDARFGDAATSSGFPGLMAKRIDLGNNDVEGELSGNILCTDCDTSIDQRDAIGAKNNGVIDGNIYIGPIDQPPVPTYPSDLTSITTPLSINNTSTSIVGGDSSTYQNACQSDGSITHCVVSDITLSGNGKELTLDTTDQPIFLYVSGDVTISGGGSGIKHIRSGSIASDEDFSRVGLFGVPVSNCSNDVPQTDDPQQTLRMGGISGDYTKLFAYLPCGEVEIMGAPGGPALTGALWAWDYDGSSSNVARLTVPDNAGSILFESMGASFSLSVRDYVALGVNSWRSFQGLSK